MQQALLLNGNTAASASATVTNAAGSQNTIALAPDCIADSRHEAKQSTTKAANAAGHSNAAVAQGCGAASASKLTVGWRAGQQHAAGASTHLGGNALKAWFDNDSEFTCSYENV